MHERRTHHLAAELDELEAGLVTVEHRLADLARITEALRLAVRRSAATVKALG